MSDPGTGTPVPPEPSPGQWQPPAPPPPPAYGQPPPGYGQPPPAYAHPAFAQPAYGQAMAAYSGGPPPIGQVRSTGICILLYDRDARDLQLVWYYKVHDEMKRHTGRAWAAGVALLLDLLRRHRDAVHHVQRGRGSTPGAGSSHPSPG